MFYSPLAPPLSERIAAWLFENTLPAANYFMDLHSGGIDETLRNFVAYPNCSGAPKVDAKARQLALSLGTEDVLIGKSGIGGGFSHSACTRVYGIPSILVETGQLGFCLFLALTFIYEGILV